MKLRAFLALLVGCVALLALTSSACIAASIGPGYSGMWFDPARNGEGLQLQIMSADAALVEWYTYDEQGRQRWLQGVGQITHGAAGDSIEFADMYVTRGGKFGPQFNPNDVKFQTVGSITLDFSDCNTGTFKYNAYGQAQTLPIQRLTQTMGAGCQSINGVPGEPVQAYAGQSGSWFDPSHSGEGYDLQWMSNGQAIITWFTYDTAGNQVWLLGTGVQRDDAIVFDHLISTSGPKFGTGYDAAAYQEHDWGSLTLTLTCNTGTARYASTQAGFGTSGLNLTHLTALQKPACPYVKPKFSDLYSIAWDEIPVSDGTSNDPNAIQADAIANDGTIAGRRAGHLVLWHPDARTWEDVPRDLAISAPMFISPDGQSVVSADGPDSGPNYTLLWRRSMGWQELTSAFSSSVPFAVSSDFTTLSGGVSNDGFESYNLWVGSIGDVQSLLPTPRYFLITTTGVSNDGDTAVGYYYPSTGDLPWPVIGLRWENGGEPAQLHNPVGDTLGAATACDASCEIIFGNGTFNTPDSPHAEEAWFLKNDGKFAYLGSLPYPGDFPWYWISDSTTNGTLAVGRYAKQIEPNNPSATIEAMLWTQNTGILSVASITSEFGIGDTDWSIVDRVQVSADGAQILVVGKRKMQPDTPRAVVLHLTPKVDAN